MGMRIIKAGLSDSFQDMGRNGFQHLGIQPSGVMDTIAAATANALLGNSLSEPVLEMHFPAATMLFETSTMISLAGADFGAQINGIDIALHQAILVPAQTELRFTKHHKGARVYVAVEEGFKIEKWLGSYSTSFLVNQGGFYGRNLKKNDLIDFNNPEDLEIDTLTHLPWRASVSEFYTNNSISFIAGSEYHLLEKISQKTISTNPYKISKQSNRMGYRLEGQALLLSEKLACLSSAVNFGTIQLLPNAQLIVLMADHQTTGGYPRVGHVATTSLPSLAQASVGDYIQFELETIESAEINYLQQQQNLQQLVNACNFRLQEYFKND